MSHGHPTAESSDSRESSEDKLVCVCGFSFFKSDLPAISEAGCRHCERKLLDLHLLEIDG